MMSRPPLAVLLRTVQIVYGPYLLFQNNRGHNNPCRPKVIFTVDQPDISEKAYQ